MLVHPERFFRPEKQIAVPGLAVMLGCWEWSGPFETMFDRSHLHRVCLHLTARPSEVLGRYSLDGRHGDYGEVGELTFAPAGSRLHHRADGTPQRVIYCEIDPARFQSVEHLLGNAFGAHELNACLDLPLSRSKQRMLQLAEEALTPDRASHVMAETLTLSTLIDIARYLECQQRRAEHQPATLTRWQMSQLEQMVHDFKGRPPTVADLAVKCGVSRGHLSRLFKATTGKSVHSYISDVRMERAKVMAVESDLPFKIIAYRAGFANQSAFSYAFSKATGLSPRAFRQRFGERTSQ